MEKVFQDSDLLYLITLKIGKDYKSVFTFVKTVKILRKYLEENPEQRKKLKENET